MCRGSMRLGPSRQLRLRPSSNALAADLRTSIAQFTTEATADPESPQLRVRHSPEVRADGPSNGLQQPQPSR